MRDPGLGDLLVFNDTRVIPARVFGQKETGGRVEILIERPPAYVSPRHPLVESLLDAAGREVLVMSARIPMSLPVS